MIISGSSNITLAKNLAKKLDLPFIQANIKRFEDQELRIEIDAKLDQQDIIILQSTSKPANDHLMELLLIADTCKRAGAKHITSIIPYFGYSRQDRPSYAHGPISARLVVNLIEAAGIDRVITLELHSKQTEGFFNIGISNLDSFTLFEPTLRKIKGELVIVSPDIGGLTRAQQYSNNLKSGLAVINKTRDSEGICKMTEVIGDVANKHCIIVDDIVDTAGTLCSAAELLMRNGAKAVSACITHPVLSKNGVYLVNNSQIENLYVTNTINHNNLPEKIKIIEIDNLLVNSV